MSCPTCSHTLGRLCIHESMSFYLCDRCGTVVVTILNANPGTDNPRVYVPKLVERCRAFEDEGWPKNGACTRAWNRLGLAESINLPENRT